jgi:hypothetical protein
MNRVHRVYGRITQSTVSKYPYICGFHYGCTSQDTPSSPRRSLGATRENPRHRRPLPPSRPSTPIAIRGRHRAKPAQQTVVAGLLLLAWPGTARGLSFKCGGDLRLEQRVDPRWRVPPAELDAGRQPRNHWVAGRSWRPQGWLGGHILGVHLWPLALCSGHRVSAGWCSPSLWCFVDVPSGLGAAWLVAGWCCPPSSPRGAANAGMLTKPSSGVGARRFLSAARKVVALVWWQRGSHIKGVWAS